MAHACTKNINSEPRDTCGACKSPSVPEAEKNDKNSSSAQNAGRPTLTGTMSGSGNGNGHRSAGSCESCSEAMKSKPVYSELSGYGAALPVSEVTSHPV